MKIVHLSRLYWPNIGGVEIHLANLNRQLADHEVTVMTEQFKNNLKLSEIHQGVIIKRLATTNSKSGWQYKWQVWRGVFHNLDILFQADVIQVHDVFWWLLPFWPMLWLRHKKIYMTFHGYEGVSQPKLNQIFWHWLAAKLTRGNLCVGGFHQQWYRVQPDFVTYGAVEMNKLPRQQRQTSQQRQNIIYVGRLAEDCGIIHYLKALIILQNQGHKFHLDVYGDGPLRKTAEQLVKRAKLKVTFFGFVERSKIDYQRYQLAFVSRHLSILEALAAGTPVVADYNNGIKYDYLTMSPFGRWIQPAANAQEIATAVLHQVQVSPAAITWARQQTWPKLASTYQQLWQK